MECAHAPTGHDLITAAFPDVNAAGSYFAMIALVPIGLALAARRTRCVWAGAASLLMMALYLTGSRAALFAVPIAGAALLVTMVRARDELRRKGMGIVVVVALAITVLSGAVPFAVNGPDRARMALAMRIRWDLTRAASAMIGSHPVFGVGIGGFKVSSARHFSGKNFGYGPRENAHNNFLQILAELGVAGFVPFLWILGGVGMRVKRGASANPVDWRLLAVAGGVFAFVATWVSGHPLLIVEVAFAFWVTLGTCVGLARVTGEQASVSPPAPAMGARSCPWPSSCSVAVDRARPVLGGVRGRRIFPMRRWDSQTGSPTGLRSAAGGLWRRGLSSSSARPRPHPDTVSSGRCELDGSRRDLDLPRWPAGESRPSCRRTLDPRGHGPARKRERSVPHDRRRCRRVARVGPDTFQRTAVASSKESRWETWC